MPSNTYNFSPVGGAASPGTAGTAAFGSDPTAFDTSTTFTAIMNDPISTLTPGMTDPSLTRVSGSMPSPPTTVGKAMELFYQLSPDQLTQLQGELYQGGFYGSTTKPQFGNYDDASYAAWKKVVVQADRSGQTIDTILHGADANANSLTVSPSANKAEIISLTDPAQLNDTVTKAFIAALGRAPTASEKAKFVDQFQTAQAAAQGARYDASHGTATAQYMPNGDGTYSPIPANTGNVTNTSGGPPDLGKFMAAIRQQESGGNYSWSNEVSGAGARGAYQFLPATYASFAKQAGVDPNDTSPEAQDKVAAYAMTQYYKQFGNWADVAKAWYAGGGFKAENQSAPQTGGPSINDYANQVIAKMSGGSGGTTPGSVQTITSVLPNDTADAKSYAQSADPIAYKAHQYVDAYNTFVGLMGGGRGGASGSAVDTAPKPVSA